MRRAILMACIVGLAGALPLSAQEPAFLSHPDGPTEPVAGRALATAASELPGPEEAATAALPWETVWGQVGLRIIGAGPKEAPNGEEYHPCFSLDLDFNYWVWRNAGLYIFADMRFWGERPEYGVTNGKDSGALGFSKRQFDLIGGPAWNYAGPWEARCFGYTLNNLNRGINMVTPSGLNDGFGVENRYYLSKEYAKLGHEGYDEARADFLSIGYYLTKNMVGNDGQTFKPGLQLRAYLTYDLWNWPAYAFADVTFLTESSFDPKQMLYDVGVAARPFCCWESLSAWRNWEFRLGVENTADLQADNVQNLWYASVRVIF